LYRPLEHTELIGFTVSLFHWFHCFTVAQAKTQPNQRQGALFAFECLASVLGILFEPFVIVVLEDMLLLIGDKKDTVREAAVVSGGGSGGSGESCVAVCG